MMKAIFWFLILLCLWAGFAWGDTFTVQWTPVPDPVDVVFVSPGVQTQTADPILAYRVFACAGDARIPGQCDVNYRLEWHIAADLPASSCVANACNASFTMTVPDNQTSVFTFMMRALTTRTEGSTGTTILVFTIMKSSDNPMNPPFNLRFA